MHRRFLQQKRLQSSSTKNLIPIRTSLKGAGLLQQPVLNKGSAFSREEREIFQVDGHIPYDVHSLEKQMVRAYAQFKRQPSNILKVFSSLQPCLVSKTYTARLLSLTQRPKSNSVLCLG